MFYYLEQFCMNIDLLCNKKKNSFLFLKKLVQVMAPCIFFVQYRYV